jgi:hypothetical protein
MMANVRRFAISLAILTTKSRRLPEIPQPTSRESGWSAERRSAGSYSEFPHAEQCSALRY